MIKYPSGKYFDKFKKEVAANKDAILNGTILTIDPASIRLGYAVAKKGVVVTQGTIELDQKATIQQRLQDIVSTLQEDDKYDMLGIEMIRGQMAHVYLKMACGAVIGSVKAPVCIEVPILVWQAFAMDYFDCDKVKDYKENYKSDDTDARMIAETLIDVARSI
jgi:hypothetical protein